MAGKIICKNCDKYTECRDSLWSWVFLFIGIMAAIAMRLVALFLHVNTVYAKISWYVGVLFFFIFFIYRYSISSKRARSIYQRDLIRKMREKEVLDDDDRKIIGEILCGLNSKKERVNFIVIFVLSGVALIIAAIVEMVR